MVLSPRDDGSRAQGTCLAAAESRRLLGREAATFDSRQEARMSRKGQFDRHPNERPAEQDAGGHDANRPEPGRKAPDLPGADRARRGSGDHPEDHPVDHATRKPEISFAGKDFLETERSDRASGRPIQLEEEQEEKTSKPDDRQQGGRQDTGRFAEDEPTRR